MEPLRGSAEQISAMTAAVMNMKTIEMMYEDLMNVSSPSQQDENFVVTIWQRDLLQEDQGRYQHCQ